ncbi:hypothetical protein Lbir_1314 [Legionella birminghamensis]|uniref:Uncharacterized protein n=1 Tax=Legionella birminghamensis TaxID=28083 RepID=A0A378IBJ2_9GAMM|nr:hypothetical protein [Legionella birminghamensis]KTC72539.1 hypothetical protein Lbir_1314 [Legionella birminghamensis]STX32152.1 Uncharacterised protein [Legionella birminghamensis]
MNDAILNDINLLLYGYKQLSWLTRWSFPNELAIALDAFDANNPTAQQAAKVYGAYLNSTGAFTRGLVSSIAKLSVFSSKREIKDQNMVPMTDSNWLMSFEQADTNRQALGQSYKPGDVAHGLAILHNAGLLTGENNRQVLVRSDRPGNIAPVLNILNNAGLVQLEEAEEPEQLNEAQSTHTASVHAATDLTMWLLASKYLQSDSRPAVSTWNEIGTAIGALSPSADLPAEVIAAANRGMTRLGRTPINLTVDAEKKSAWLKSDSQTSINQPS